MIKQFENFNKKIFTKNTIYNLIYFCGQNLHAIISFFQLLVAAKINPQLKDLLVASTYPPSTNGPFSFKIKRGCDYSLQNE